MKINLDAPILSMHQILVRAPLEAVWFRQTDPSRWMEWQPEIDRSSGPEELSPGDEFTWETAGMTIASKVADVDPPNRIVWSGEADGVKAVHEWRFSQVREGTLVETFESWDGDFADVPAMRMALDESLFKWLVALKHDVEQHYRREGTTFALL